MMSQPEPTDAAVSDGAKSYKSHKMWLHEIRMQAATAALKVCMMPGISAGIIVRRIEEDLEAPLLVPDLDAAFIKGAKWGAVEALKITHKPHEIQAFGGSFEWLSIEEQADRILADPLKRLAKGE